MGRRGILPSLGAGTSLIVAGVLCLAVLSSIMAFRGFPGLDPGLARPPVQLATPAADAAGRSAPAPIVVGAAAGSAALAAPLRRPDARGSARARADGPLVRVRDAPSSGSGSSPVAPVTEPVATPSTDRPVAATETPAPSSRARPVGQAVDRVRDLAAPVLPPPAPPAVQPVVDDLVGTANQVADQAAGAADELVGGVVH